MADALKTVLNMDQHARLRCCRAETSSARAGILEAHELPPLSTTLRILTPILDGTKSA